MPAVFALVKYGTLNVTTDRAPMPLLSLLVAIVLLVIYFANLIFSLKTHQMLLAPTAEMRALEAGQSSARFAGMVLLAATVLTACMSALLVREISGATHALHMTNFFVGIVVVAIIGNAAEFFSAVALARKNKMEIAVTIATAASTQVALFVAPVLVFASCLFGHPMSLIFNPFEITGIVLSVAILAVVTLDGESNWFEGLQLLGVYAVLAIVFYFV
jgi:Ca2+:H+ antiporter